MPSHYLNQCWDIVNWTLGKKLKWNLNRNLYIYVQENAFENGLRTLADILCRPQYVRKNVLVMFFILSTLFWIQWCGELHIWVCFSIWSLERDQGYMSPRFYEPINLMKCILFSSFFFWRSNPVVIMPLLLPWHAQNYELIGIIWILENMDYEFIEDFCNGSEVIVFEMLAYPSWNLKSMGCVILIIGLFRRLTRFSATELTKCSSFT